MVCDRVSVILMGDVQRYFCCAGFSLLISSAHTRRDLVHVEIDTGTRIQQGGDVCVLP